MTDIANHIRPEPKRDQYGRYLIEGKPYTRVTTWAESVDDRYNLEQWKLRMAAKGITERPDLFAQIASIPLDDKKALNRVVSDAIDAAKGKAAANLGTALHRFTERIDAGEDVTVPAPWDRDLAAYRSTLDAHGVCVMPDMIERIVVNDTLQIAGTFDRLVDIGLDLPMVADVKTGADLSYAFTSIAIQLACYAYADHLYDPMTDSLAPMPAVDRERALVIHLPAGRGECNLFLLDIEAGWEAAQLCGRVRAWRKRKDLATVLGANAINATDILAERRTWLVERIGRLRDDYPEVLATVASMWPVGVPTLKQADDHTAEQLDQIAQAVRQAEAQHRIPFDDHHEARAEIATLVEGEQRARDMVTALEAACDGDEDLMSAIVTAIPDGCDIRVVDAIAAAFDRQLVVMVYTEQGEPKLTVPDIDDLKGLYGDGRKALAALKTLADTIGVERPTSLAKAAEQPALVALAVASATNNKETQ